MSRSATGARVDLFPFLSVILCITGVQAIVLVAEASFLPLAQRASAMGHAYYRAELHPVYLRPSTWEIPEREVVVALPDMQSEGRVLGDVLSHEDAWRDALGELVTAIVGQTASVAPVSAEPASEEPTPDPDRKHLIEVHFDESSIDALRNTLAVLDELRAATVGPNGGAAFGLSYRPLEANP